ncbi:histidine phosphatase family protein, partial [Mycobacterium stomatepiae]
MANAVSRARSRAAGHEVVCVSHQLPVWTARQHLTGNRLWHDPRRRECGVGSVTTLIYVGDRLVEVDYQVPAGG